jgi:RNA polymerase subunit RPABC4/transcription elongation factor Spt4
MANTVSLQHTPCNPRGLLYIYPFEQGHILFRGFDGTWFRGNNAVWVDSRNAAKENFDVFWCAILQPETEDIAARANQKSASKFSVKSQHHLSIMILFWRAILRPETEDIASRANQKSASKFSAQSQHVSG